MATTEELTKQRRNCKGSLTRALNSLGTALTSPDISPEMVTDLFDKARAKFEAVENAHSKLVDTVDNDEAYEKEEEWMATVQATFLASRLAVEVFMKQNSSDKVTGNKATVSESPGGTSASADTTGTSGRATEQTSETTPPDTNADGTAGATTPEDATTSITDGTAGATTSRSRLSDFNEIKIALELPKTEYMKFDGNPVKYFSFITNFEVNIESKLSSNPARLQHLKTMCIGKARCYIECCDLLGDEGFSEAKRILRTQFGQPHMILDALMRELVDRRPVRPHDSDALWDLIASMKKCFVTLTKLGYTNDLNSTTNLLKIQDLLPNYLQTSWVKTAHDILRKGAGEPTFSDLLDFLVKKAEVSSTMFGKYFAQSKKGQGKQQIKFKSNSVSSTVLKCFICDNEHKIFACQEFLQSEYNQRVQLAMSKRLCFRCLAPGHVVTRCRRTWKCDCGSEKHHKLLHPPGEEVKVNSGVVASGNKIYMRILPVVVTATNGNKVSTLALLDQGSDTSLCSDKLRKKLGVRGQRVAYTSSTIHGDKDDEGWRFGLCVRGEHEHDSVNIDFLTVPRIPASADGIPSRGELRKWSHLASLPLGDYRDQEVDILIGADSPDAFWVLEEKRGKPRDPYGIRTPLGWTVMGPGGKAVGKYHFNKVHVSNERLLSEVQKSWAVECSGLHETEDSMEDIRARSIMESTIRKTPDGHYEMGLLWKHDNHELPFNRPMAESRLGSLKRRLAQNREMHAAYTDTIEGYIKEGYAEEVTGKGVSGNVWYLPHHPVVHPHKGKIRVVYDCAAKFAGTSLNDQLLKGPDMINDLLGVLLRFRLGKVAIVSDIEAMFHQVLMRQQDRDVLRFLWWRNGELQTQPKEYRMRVHLFGATSSPCCAGKALKQTADDGEQTNSDGIGKQALAIIRNGFYVDDCLGSVPDAKTAILVAQRLSSILREGGFRLTKWLSNDRKVLESIDPQDRAPSVRLEVDQLPTERTLGVCWDANSDTFTFKLTMRERSVTRRGLLSVTSSVFDPVGMVSPFVMIARSLLQEVCRRGADWDQPLTDSERAAWSKWLEDASKLSHVAVHRWFGFHDSARAQLHIFCDASEKGYAAVAYFRVEQTDCEGYSSVEFVLGKTRVSPLKPVTIPRLELMAAVLATTLDSTIRRELGSSFCDSTFWSDSTIVLSYLRNESRRYKTFVANRVAKILSVSTWQQWRHVPSEENPADGGSRGTQDLQKWLGGPEFLRKEQESWPVFTLTEPDKEDLEIKRSATVQRAAVRNVEAVNGDVISRLVDRFSSWTKLRRVLAWVLRASKVFKAKGHQPLVRGSLLVAEIAESETKLLSWEQRRLFPDWQTDSRLTKLNPVLMGTLLRVGGRLDNAHISEDAKHPIILADGGEIARKLIWHHHLEVGHSGWAATLNAIRERFWILKGRSGVKSVLRNCVTCKRHNARREEQVMAALPEERVTADKAPFTYTGVDYFGPIDVKQGRSTIKMYGCIFTCLASRAVHIEVADSLDADAFINAYRRFVARRGDPLKMFSDNGTNFVAAEKDLKKALNQMNRDRVEEALHTKGVEWHFNPPTASHFGGVWERLIRSVRKTLYGILKQQRVDKDTLQTVLTEIENILNSRPLTDLSPEAYDAEPLTPNHLLLMRNGATAPIGRAENYGKRRWLQAQYMASLFWTRWKKEYLHTLQKRHKWVIPRRNVKENDIVLLVDEVLPRGKWQMAKVLRVHRSKDGKVRSVDLKIPGGTLKRPIAKLCIVHRETAS